MFLSSPSLILPSVWFILLWILSVAFFIFITEFFNSRISVWFFFYDLYLSVKFPILFMNCLLDYIELSVFSCGSFSFLKTAILSSLSAKLQNSMTLNQIVGGLLSFSDISSTLNVFGVYIPVFLFWGNYTSLNLYLSSDGRYFLLFLLVSVTFSNLLWIRLFHTSCSLLWQTS